MRRRLRISVTCKAILLWSGSIYSVSVDSFHYHHITSSCNPPVIQTVEMTLVFIDLTCDCLARVLFLLCGFVCFELFCPLAEDPSSPEGSVDSANSGAFLHLSSNRCWLTSLSAPALRVRSLGHCFSSVLVFHCREMQENHPADICQLIEIH